MTLLLTLNVYYGPFLWWLRRKSYRLVSYSFTGQFWWLWLVSSALKMNWYVPPCSPQPDDVYIAFEVFKLCSKIMPCKRGNHTSCNQFLKAMCAAIEVIERTFDPRWVTLTSAVALGTFNWPTVERKTVTEDSTYFMYSEPMQWYWKYQIQRDDSDPYSKKNNTQ